jgi:hypothetical protein
MASSFDLGAVGFGSFSFGGNAFTQLYLNANGTLSFGAGFLDSGPNATSFIDGGAGTAGIVAGGYGDYSDGAWAGSALLPDGSVKFDFSGHDFVTGLSNAFHVKLFQDSTLQLGWDSVFAPASILVGVSRPGDPANAAEVDLIFSNFQVSPATPLFFQDFSLPGAPEVSLLNGYDTNQFAAPVPEPVTGVLVLIGLGALAASRRR